MTHYQPCALSRELKCAIRHGSLPSKVSNKITVRLCPSLSYDLLRSPDARCEFPHEAPGDRSQLSFKDTGSKMSMFTFWTEKIDDFMVSWFLSGIP